MDGDRRRRRRHFLREPKPAPLPTAETSPPITFGTCGICGSPDYVWDSVLDFHVCLKCGAHETAKGWQAR